jgi:hypothetical protein
MMAEDVSQFLKPKFSRHLFYDTDGNTTENEVPKACAYIITIDDKESYYVKFLRGSLFDPQGIDGLKINSLNSSYKKVEKKTFDFYVDYLKTKKRNHLTWAERSNIDV